jgi:hypothetical protein
MSRNANEFEIRLLDLLSQYQAARDTLENHRRRLTGSHLDSRSDLQAGVESEVLEAHVRVYLIDGILASLGWTMEAGSNPVGQILVEQPIRERFGSSVKFMDYLGIERRTDRPLLIVETKRPGAKLPQIDGRPPEHGTATEYCYLVAKGLADPERLNGDWSKWIRQLGGYPREVNAQRGLWPSRVVLTNGDWMIIFEDPADAFGDSREKDPNRIVVLPRLQPVEHTAAQIFRSLAYRQLVADTGPLSPANLLFHMTATDVDRVCHGLRVTTGHKRGKFKIEPTIYVQPILFLRTKHGVWFRIQEHADEHEVEVPHKTSDLVVHLRAVDAGAKALLSRVNHHLGAQLVPIRVVDHYSDVNSFDEIKGLTRLEGTEFEIMTGEWTHYLLEQPRVLECPFHHWDRSRQAGHPATEAAILKRSVDPKSFFVSGEDHHCSHRAVRTVKSYPLGQAIAARCGPRSGSEGQAFCEVFPLDHHLCCQVCAFHDACRRSEVFRLPCHQSSD